MTTQDRVREFVRLVEAGRFLDAFDEYYAESVEMQENSSPPMLGKAANRERERAFVGAIATVHENRAASVVVDGDRSAINWRAEFTFQDGSRLRFDQVALQTWKDGRIVRERFYYDPATLGVPARAA